ncbi:short chain dehydrogenase [Lactococcus lactis]|uniref:short chain dehydrogenase n=1 Tax=Lactococcus lactis TaxID=1358 RepID=UPI002418AA06|nr:short chain dehydrogenase [Lactococcus lactis]MDG4967106.1 short chain dehydrogenase [Lactococcus lactis]
MSRTSGDYRIDITKPKTISSLFEKVGKVDSIVSTTGFVDMSVLSELTPEKIFMSLENKVAGQTNIALIGQHYLMPGGSITLTTGVIHDEFIKGGVSASMANGAITSFVEAASYELEDGKRINAVSAYPLKNSWGNYAPYFRGFLPVDSDFVYAQYEKSIYGIMAGNTFKAYQ